MKKLLFIILFVIVNTCWAKLPTVYDLHINGINTTRIEAEFNTKSLKEAAQINTNLIKWDLVYNPTGDDAGKTFWGDLDDVMHQKFDEGNIMSLDDFTYFYILNNPDKYPENIYHEGTPEYEQLKNQISSLYVEQLKQSSGDNLDVIIDEFHQKIPAKFAAVMKLLSTGTQNTATQNYADIQDSVLLIPHSQGNLYANELYTYLTQVEQFPADKLGILGIASPANIVLGTNSTYITSRGDYVINSLRVLFGGILPANIDINNSADWEGHSLINTYLNDTNSRDTIVASINGYFLMRTFDYVPWNLDGPKYALFDVEISPSYGSRFQLLDGTGNIICIDHTCPINDGYILPSPFLPIDRSVFLYDRDRRGNYTVLTNADVIPDNMEAPMFWFSNNTMTWYYYLTCDDHPPNGGDPVCNVAKEELSDYAYSAVPTDAAQFILDNNLQEYFRNGMIIKGGFGI